MQILKTTSHYKLEIKMRQSDEEKEKLFPHIQVPGIHPSVQPIGPHPP